MVKNFDDVTKWILTKGYFITTAIQLISVFLLLLLTVTILLYVFSHARAITSSESAWIKGAPMPTPRTEVTAALLEDNIYVIGGFNRSGHATDIVEDYNIGNNSWNTLVAPLPELLHHASAASYDGKIYVVGGYGYPWIPSNKLFVYDPFKNKWQEGKSMSTYRGALNANFVDGILYAVGGQNNSTGILSTNEAYDPTTNVWIEKNSMPTARHHAASAVGDGKLYVIGGRVGDIFPTVNVNVNEMYDPQQDRWITLEPMPSNRSGIAAAAAAATSLDSNNNNSSSSIYVVGGEEPSKTFSDNERYNSKSNKWSSEAPMPTARHGLAAVEANGKIYVIGGGPKPNLSVSNANEIFLNQR